MAFSTATATTTATIEVVGTRQMKSWWVDQCWCQMWICIVHSRVVSPEISSGKFPEIYSYLEIFKFPEIFTENFPPVQIFQIDVYLLTSSLTVGFYSTSGL